MRNIRCGYDYRTLMRLLDNHIRTVISICSLFGWYFEEERTKAKKVAGNRNSRSEICRFLQKLVRSGTTISARTQLACKGICDFTEILFCKVAIRITNQVLSILDDPIEALLSLFSPFYHHLSFFHVCRAFSDLPSIHHIYILLNKRPYAYVSERKP